MDIYKTNDNAIPPDAISASDDVDDDAQRPNVLALVPGNRYHILMEDCCIEGEFTAKFLYWEPSDCGEIKFNFAVFDNGVKLGPCWGKWKVTPCSEEAEKPS